MCSSDLDKTVEPKEIDGEKTVGPQKGLSIEMEQKHDLNGLSDPILVFTPKISTNESIISMKPQKWTMQWNGGQSSSSSGAKRFVANSYHHEGHKSKNSEGQRQNSVRKLLLRIP